MPKHVGPLLTDSQYLLVAHPLRIRILHALAGAELTAAQFADSLGETRGNVHYHIQKLHQGGLLELVRTEPHGGILERYYHAATARFQSPEASDSSGGHRALTIKTWLERTPSEVEALLETLEALLGAWERVGSTDGKRAQTWEVTVRFQPVEGTPEAHPEEDR